jgi:ABC-type nitrate/sulfonate/bicarbonate transport system permease component
VPGAWGRASFFVFCPSAAVQIFKMNIVMTGITILAIVSSLMYLAISWLEAAVMRHR